MSWPSTVVPSRNSTFVTLPSGSLAVAVTVIVGFQAKIAPSAGEVMFAVGAVFEALTVIVDGALVVVAPRLSVARAVSVYVPAATPLQVKLYGAVVSSPSFAEPLKNSTFVDRAVGVGRRRGEIHRGGRREGRAVRRLRERDGRRRVVTWTLTMRATDGTPLASTMKSM